MDQLEATAQLIKAIQDLEFEVHSLHSTLLFFEQHRAGLISSQHHEKFLEQSLDLQTRWMTMFNNTREGVQKDEHSLD